VLSEPESFSVLTVCGSEAFFKTKGAPGLEPLTKNKITNNAIPIYNDFYSRGIFCRPDK